MIKAVVVDDEVLARKKILNLLEDHDDIKVIASCKNGSEAIDTINKKEPDLVFLDIQMPDLDGFEVLKQVQCKSAPYIIFATAYDQYALKAFEVHALDYLLKPFDDERFSEALQQAKNQIQLKNNQQFRDRLLALVSEYQQEPGAYLEAFRIKQRGKTVTVNTEDLYYLEANGNYVNLHTDSVNYLYRTTMNAVEKDLNPNDFLRIHRSIIINKKFVKNYRYLGNNEFKFVLKNKKELQSSRSFKDVVSDFISHF